MAVTALKEPFMLNLAHVPLVVIFAKGHRFWSSWDLLDEQNQCSKNISTTARGLVFAKKT
jgi:hypothetical protein